MKRLLAAPFLLAFLAAASAPPKVDVATGDWSNLPPLKFISYDHMMPTIMTKIHKIGREKQCQFPGQWGTRTDMSISFAAQFGEKGELERLLLPPLNCPAAESWLGAALVKSVQNGDFRPTGENPEGWYRGEFSFDYED